jgi:hypothetical protein
MRPAAAILCLGLVLASSGCDFWRKQFNHNGGNGDLGRIPVEVPTANQLVAYLNDNASRVRAVQCNRVEVDGKVNGSGIPGLDGLMVCQKPNYFRMRAKAFGQPALDIGSNKDEFWFWVSKAEPVPYVWHCSYTELARGGVQLPFPFQPEMVINALGIAEYDPQKKYEVRPTPQTLELIEDSIGLDGQPVQKVTVFNRAMVQVPTPQVKGYFLRDRQGQILCRAEVIDTQLDPQTNAVLPHRVKLVWPKEKMELTMKLGDMRAVPPVDPEQPQGQRMYTRKDLSHLPGFDLARRQPDSPTGIGQGTNLQRTGVYGTPR